MVIGACCVRLRLPGCASLKAKRGVLRSVTARIQNRFKVAVAEVDDHERWQTATIGICCISTSDDHAHQILSKVVAFLEQERPDIEIVDYEVEIIHAL